MINAENMDNKMKCCQATLTPNTQKREEKGKKELDHTAEVPVKSS